MAQGNSNTVEFTLKAILKSWFETGKFPTQTQFHALFDSYWHKSDLIPTSKIAGLDALLNQAVIYKKIKGNFIINTLEITNHTLVVGNTYYILESDFDNRDDFSNVGFVSFGVPFVATAAIADSWNDTVVYRLIFKAKIFEDTLTDDYCFIYNPSNNSVFFVIENKFKEANGFVWSKTKAKEIDDSTLELFPFNDYYLNSFEILIYNEVK